MCDIGKMAVEVLHTCGVALAGKGQAICMSSAWFEVQ